MTMFNNKLGLHLWTHPYHRPYCENAAEVKHAYSHHMYGFFNVFSGRADHGSELLYSNFLHKPIWELCFLNVIKRN